MDHPKEEGCHNCDCQTHFFHWENDKPKGSVSLIKDVLTVGCVPGYGALQYFIWDIMSL